MEIHHISKAYKVLRAREWRAISELTQREGGPYNKTLKGVTRYSIEYMERES